MATTAYGHTFPLNVMRDKVCRLLLTQVTRQMRGVCGMLVLLLGKFGRAFDEFQINKRLEKHETTCNEKGEAIHLSKRV
jgi:hypothetical protein